MGTFSPNANFPVPSRQGESNFRAEAQETRRCIEKQLAGIRFFALDDEVPPVRLQALEFLSIS